MSNGRSASWRRPLLAGLALVSEATLASAAKFADEASAGSGVGDAASLDQGHRKGCGNSCYYSAGLWGSFVLFWAIFWYCVVRSLFGPDAEKKDIAKD